MYPCRDSWNGIWWTNDKESVITLNTDRTFDLPEHSAIVVRFRGGMDMSATMIGESLPDIGPVEIEGEDSVTVTGERVEH